MIEPISPTQAAEAEKNLEICKEGLAQQAEQAAEDAGKKATNAINKANQQLAKVPEELIESLQEIIKKLMNVICSWESPADPNFDPDKVIADLKKMLDPAVEMVVKLVSDVGMPEIPGLKDISELLAKLSSMKKPNPPTESMKLKLKKPDIPSEWKQTLLDLRAAVTALAITLPLIFINFLVNAVNEILGVKIPVVGLSLWSLLSAVPYVKQIPDLITLVPKTIELIPNFPTKIKSATEGKIREQVQAIQDLSIPPKPEATKPAIELPACPQRG